MQFCLKKKEKLKTRSTKIMKHLVEYKTLADIYLLLKESHFPKFFTETAPELERKKKNNCKFKNSPIFFKKYIFKVLTDIR